MTITLELSPDQERRLRDGAARHNVQAVRAVLLQAVDSTVEALLRPSVSPPEAGKLSVLLYRLASELCDAPALSDDAISHAGIYAGHPLRVYLKSSRDVGGSQPLSWEDFR
jgi:hypothetical protein